MIFYFFCFNLESWSGENGATRTGYFNLIKGREQKKKDFKLNFPINVNATSWNEIFKVKKWGRIVGDSHFLISDFTAFLTLSFHLRLSYLIFINPDNFWFKTILYCWYQTSYRFLIHTRNGIHKLTKEVHQRNVKIGGKIGYLHTYTHTRSLSQQIKLIKKERNNRITIAI